MTKGKETAGVVGLGYVGLPAAAAFAEKYHVTAFDIDESRIERLKAGVDDTGSVPPEELKKASITFTADPARLKDCQYIIVVVPTPINEYKEPDVTYLANASKIVGENMAPGTSVIYESTVYPGATEERCIPLLEQYSGMKAEQDFYVGYSPERINPGDKEHTFKTITKVAAAQSEASLHRIAAFYQSVMEADVHKVSSIKTAEASKVVENTQRDINIAFMNELSVLFQSMGINTRDVLEAAQTKWNFIPVTPGLVGGHCIGVDPYYLIYRAKREGKEAPLLSTSRKINEDMTDYIVTAVMQKIISHNLAPSSLNITILGASFKENIGDTRNSKALEVAEKIQHLGLSLQIHDPHVPSAEPFPVSDMKDLTQADILLILVPHAEYQTLDDAALARIVKRKTGIIFDIKGVLDKKSITDFPYIYQL
ncbi:nucleotide sugar dehydrogenase [Salibacterium lacus]|uniref:Nucleotide sugar dehydrogenase n=1 Tax=Salibacterium lacus TaxID=1898109 RepID=A0ABW5T5M5_9BACI